MSLFHDEEDGTPEPVRGLPAELPEGEELLWQGQSSAIGLAVHAFHIRFIAAYFIVSAIWRAWDIMQAGTPLADAAAAAVTLIGTGAAAIAVLSLIARYMARASVFTITNKRVVLRFGVAIPKYINLPFGQLASAAVRNHGGTHGDIVLALSDKAPVGYLHLWPFARPLRILKPSPMLRAIHDVDTAARILGDAVARTAPRSVERPAPSQSQNPTQAPGGAMPAT